MGATPVHPPANHPTHATRGSTENETGGHAGREAGPGDFPNAHRDVDQGKDNIIKWMGHSRSVASVYI